jgi:protein TonB
MTANSAYVDPLDDPHETRRWLTALGVVLCVHAAPALLAANWSASSAHVAPPEPPVLIDMAPPAAPPEPPPEPPKPKQEPLPKPKAVREVVRTPPVPEPAAVLPETPEPPREETKPVEPPPPAAPPAPKASSGLPTWQGLLLAHLDKHKRYPRDAQFRRQQGVPYIRFVMDREGRVLSSVLERSSGFVSLDREAVDLPRRAQPLPKPPDDVEGATIELVVPVEFSVVTRR